MRVESLDRSRFIERASPRRWRAPQGTAEPPAAPHRQRGRSAAGDRSTNVAASVLKFSISGVAALAVVGIVAVLALRNIGTTQAIKDATNVTEVVARAAIAPHLTDELLRGDPAAIGALDRLVKGNVLNDTIVRVKVWNRQGRILYSDEARLIGETYALDEAKAAAFTGPSSADVSDLSGPENVYEPRGQELFEVYAPIRSVSGEPLLFEAYLKGTSIESSGRRTWLAFIPAVVLGLVVLELIQVPLAWSMARRIARTQKEREMLLTRAIEASDEERRRIAAGIHDGVVQDLVGLSFTLTAVANRLDTEDQQQARASVLQSAASTRNNVRQLRQLLVDIPIRRCAWWCSRRTPSGTVSSTPSTRGPRAIC